LNKQSQLFFRQEALDAKQDRLHGEVIVKQTMSTIVMTGVLISIIIIAVLWITLGEYARTEQVRGILRTTQPSSKIMASRAGLVIRLHIKEGQVVQKGDTLAIVNVDRISEDGSAFAAASLGTIDNRISLAGQQVKIANNLARANQQELSGIIASNNHQINDIQNQITLQRQIVKSNQSLFDKVGNLVERGFVSQIDYEGRRQNLLNSQQSLSRLEQQLGNLRSERARAQSQLTQSRLSFSREIIDMSSATESLSQQRAQLMSEKSFTIIAPISGRVTAMQITEGKTARPN